MQLAVAERRRDGVVGLHLEADRQRAELELVGEGLRGLLGEAAGDLRPCRSVIAAFVVGAVMTRPSSTIANWFRGAGSDDERVGDRRGTARCRRR